MLILLKNKIDFRKYIKAFKNVDLALIGNETQHSIITRTQKGLDVNMKEFDQYNKHYKRQKIKKYGDKGVNLTREEHMLNSITFEKAIVRGSVGIRFKFNAPAQLEKAYWNQVVNKRYFFGVDEKQKAKIRNFIVKEIRKQLMK